MSDHLDGMSVRSNTKLDISDVYLFKGTSGVVLVMNTDPFSGAGGFDHECAYTFAIDLNGDAVPDISLRATFGDEDSSGSQSVTLRMVTGRAAADPSSTGVTVARGRSDAIVSGSSGIRLFAGRAADPFYIEPSVVTAVKNAVTQGTALDLSGFDPGSAHNLFAGTNVKAIVVEVPVPCFGAGQRIGFWGETWIPMDSGPGWRRIDRAANPLVSTLFGMDDPFNAASPADDQDAYGDLFRGMVAQVVKANNSASDPDAYAGQVIDALLPDVLPYVVGTQAYWLAQPPAAGKPARNGRDLTGNHPNEMFRLMLNMSVDDCLDANSATGTLRATFPYLSAPV